MDKPFVNSMHYGPRAFFYFRLLDVEVKYLLTFLLIILIGFWPVSSGLFSLKNDEINYFLPYRYTIVESIRNWQFPLWSPYVYMGFPIAGDMQSGAWNPVVWLLAITGRYTLTTLHAELLIYIYFAAVGMFKLMRALQFKNIVCFTIAVSYAFSGFIIDSGQFICWISCACFLPYTYLYFIRLLAHPNWAVCAKFALAKAGLLIIGGYPFFFIANVYFLAIGFLVFLTIFRRKQEFRKVVKTFKYLSFSVLLFLIVSAAPLLSFINLLPFYARGTYLPLEAALFNSYAVFSSISFLFPFSITRDHVNFGSNNVLSRNLYIGIILLPFIISGVFTKRTIAWNAVLACLLLAFMLSMGEMLPFRTWTYRWLPLMNTFRHPSNFRLFITVGLLSFAARGLNEFLLRKREEDKKKILMIFYLLLLCLVVTGIYYLPLNETNPFTGASGTAEGLKKILTRITFRQAVLFSLLVQLPFLTAAILLLKKRKYALLCSLAILNVIVLGQPQLLSSTVSKNPVYTINKFIRNQPQGFPAPSLLDPVAFPDENRLFVDEYKEPVQYFFNKKVAINTFITTPTILKTYADFINDSSLLSGVKNYPFIYLADSGTKRANDAVAFISFKPGRYEIAIKLDSAAFLVILQNNLVGWKANADGKSLAIKTVNRTFIGVPVPAGTNTLTVEYKPGWFLPGIVVSVLGLLILFFLTCQRNSGMR